MNKIGLKIRAAVITTVYNKSLAVSLTTLSKFSTGEVSDYCVILFVVLVIFSLHFDFFFLLGGYFLKLHNVLFLWEKFINIIGSSVIKIIIIRLQHLRLRNI